MNDFDMNLTKKLVNEYNSSDKNHKDEILIEYIKLTLVKRSIAVQRFNRFYKKKLESNKKQRGRKKIFHQLHKNLIELAWNSSGLLCAELLHSVLPEIITDFRVMNCKKCSIKEKYKIFGIKKQLSLVELRQKSNEIKHKLFKISRRVK